MPTPSIVEPTQYTSIVELSGDHVNVRAHTGSMDSRSIRHYLDCLRPKDGTAIVFTHMTLFTDIGEPGWQQRWVRIDGDWVTSE